MEAANWPALHADCTPSLIRSQVRLGPLCWGTCGIQLEGLMRPCIRRVVALLFTWHCVSADASGCRKAPPAQSSWCGLPEQLSNFQGEEGDVIQTHKAPAETNVQHDSKA